ESLKTFYSFSSLFLGVGMVAALAVPIALWPRIENGHLYLLAPFLALLYGSVLFLQTIFTAERKRGLAGGVLVLDSWLKVTVALIGLYLFKWTVSNWFFWFGMCS